MLSQETLKMKLFFSSALFDFGHPNLRQSSRLHIMHT